jgi:UDP-N-acetylmuramoylalanine--D-glutamate ligase
LKVFCLSLWRYKELAMIDYKGKKIVIMGLGLNGGGLAAARFLAKRGARLTVTDTRDEKALAPSLEQLKDFDIRYVLGHHDRDDFIHADMVIKNPGVKPSSPFLLAAGEAGVPVETDIALFLRENREACHQARLFCVTGSKGKSSTVSALHWVLSRAREEGLLSGKAYLGGNITVSPLTFLDSLRSDDDVVLELSSWQLGDLRKLKAEDGKGLLRPRAAIITAIMADHQDFYGNMESYVADKRLIYRDQDKSGVTVVGDDSWGKSFLAETPARPLVYHSGGLSPNDRNDRETGGWLIDSSEGLSGWARVKAGEKLSKVVPEKLLTPGEHQKKNMLAAALALLDTGLPADFIAKSLASFPGIEHRLECFLITRSADAKGDLRWYNDSAATIPEAAAAAIEAFKNDPGKLVLVSGGTDKNLDFSPQVEAISQASRAGHIRGLILFRGSGTDKLRPLLLDAGLEVKLIANSAEEAVAAAQGLAKGGDVVLLSPGCTSFGMFANEFDRGRKWKDACIRLSK